MANALNGSNSNSGGGTTYPSIVDVAGEIKLSDALIQIGNDSPLSDTIDSGFYSKYFSSGTKYTGLARLANYGTKDYWLFAGSSLNPQTDATYSLTSNLASLHTGSLFSSSIFSNNLLLSGNNTLTAIAASGTGNLFSFVDTASTNIYNIDGSGNFVLNTKNISGVNNLSCASLTTSSILSNNLQISTNNTLAATGITSGYLFNFVDTTNTNIYSIDSTGNFVLNTKNISGISNLSCAKLASTGEVMTINSGNTTNSVVISSNLSSFPANKRSVLIGKPGNTLMTGDKNILLGCGTGSGLTTGSMNVIIGDASGQSLLSGSSNVFIGNAAGSAETGSNKLYIANTNTTTPLIGGDFSSQYVNIYNKLNVNSTQTTQSFYVNGNSQFQGQIGLNVPPSIGAAVNLTGQTTNGNEAQTLYVSGSPLRNGTFSGNYNSITTYFTDSSTTGALYNYYGLNIGQNAGQSARVANSIGAFIANPNISTVGNNIALYAEDLYVGGGIGANRVPNGIYCSGGAQFQSQLGIGNTVVANTRMYLAGGYLATENYNIQSNAYPTRAVGASVSMFTNTYIYGNWTYLAGGLLNYIGLDVGNTPGANPFINTSIGIYARNPNGATNPVNNIAIYADDISVGNTLNKIANGIYCSSDMKCGGNLYNGSYSTTAAFYATNSTATTISFTGGATASPVISYARIGRVCTVSIPSFAATLTANMSSIQILSMPSGFAPGATQSSTVWLSNGSTYLNSQVKINSTGSIYLYYGHSSTLGVFPPGSYYIIPETITITYMI